MEDALAETAPRRSFVRAAAISAVVAIPIVARLARPQSAKAVVECTDLICSCADCLVACPNDGFQCAYQCFDAHDGTFCGYRCNAGCLSCRLRFC
jgi:hypothetical protein